MGILAKIKSKNVDFNFSVTWIFIKLILQLHNMIVMPPPKSYQIVVLRIGELLLQAGMMMMTDFGGGEDDGHENQKIWISGFHEE